MFVKSAGILKPMSVIECTIYILGRELGPSGVSLNQCSPWKYAFLLLKTCLIYTIVTQQPFGIPSRNLGTCIFVASSTSIFNHIFITRDSEVIMFSPCVFVCLCVCVWLSMFVTMFVQTI